jgi:arginine N-succinyltransferase
MVIIRPAVAADLDELVRLADVASFGLTSLPKAPDVLAQRLQDSIRSFQFPVTKPKGELYIFVMEDLETGTVVGTSYIVSKVGGFEPFYAFRVETCIHESQYLDIRKEISTLHLMAEHSGPCEIGGLFLTPEYRKHGNGRLLSLFRFLFMADFPERFEHHVIAEMRGVVGEDGRSPFWEALGRHFFEMDFPKADYLSCSDKQFISDLMPKCPIYIPLLPEDAQQAIGNVHPETRPALKMLLDEGFRNSGMVDIFEAGPIIATRLSDIRIVRESSMLPVEDIVSQEGDCEPVIISNANMDFRACMTRPVRLPGGGIGITSAVAQALGTEKGTTVRVSPLKPGLDKHCWDAPPKQGADHGRSVPFH